MHAQQSACSSGATFQVQERALDFLLRSNGTSTSDMGISPSCASTARANADDIQVLSISHLRPAHDPESPRWSGIASNWTPHWHTQYPSEENILLKMRCCIRRSSLWSRSRLVSYFFDEQKFIRVKRSRSIWYSRMSVCSCIPGYGCISPN